MTEMEELALFTPYLEAGERILWQGKPGKGHFLTVIDIYLVPFSAVWCSGAILGTIFAFLGNAPLGATLLCILFSVIGLNMAFGRFIWKHFRRNRTFYAITNRKILWKCGNSTEILDRSNMPAIHVKLYKDGNGTILFGQEWNYHRHSGRFAFPAPGLWTFENVPDAMKVYQFLVNKQ